MFKRLFMMVLVGGAMFAAWHATHPQPVAAVDAESDAAAAVDNSLTGRIEARIGEVVARMTGGQIRASIQKTERQLAMLKPAMDRTGGSSGRNARDLSKKIMAIDSLAMGELDGAHPINAVRRVMDARGYIELIRADVSDETAAR